MLLDVERTVSLFVVWSLRPASLRQTTLLPARSPWTQDRRCRPDLIPIVSQNPRQGHTTDT